MVGGVVGNLLEKYWFLDSFGAYLGGEKLCRRLLYKLFTVC